MRALPDQQNARSEHLADRLPPLALYRDEAHIPALSSSQIASASAESFFSCLTNALKSTNAISQASRTHARFCARRCMRRSRTGSVFAAP